MAKKTTYANIRKIDPVKFFDLESTMRMLYDHGNLFAGCEESYQTVSDVESVKKTVPSGRKAKTKAKVAEATATAVIPTKRKTRPVGSLIVSTKPQN